MDIPKYAEKLTKHAHVFIAKTDIIAGFATLYANDTINKIAYIPYIGVEANSHNQSIGTILLEECFTKAVSVGMEKIKLEVQKDNTIAQSFYKKNGFYISDIKDRNSIYMEKDL